MKSVSSLKIRRAIRVSQTSNPEPVTSPPTPAAPAQKAAINVGR
jgi:hypothetical protein